eukprot:gene998-3829_t
MKEAAQKLSAAFVEALKRGPGTAAHRTQPRRGMASISSASTLLPRAGHCGPSARSPTFLATCSAQQAKAPGARSRVHVSNSFRGLSPVASPALQHAWRVVRATSISKEDQTTLELTEENVEKVLDEVRPFLMADGGNVDFVAIEGATVMLRLVGACSSCPSSVTTMTMGIQKRLVDRIPAVMDVQQVIDEVQGLELTEENVESVLDEMRPYLVGPGGGELSLISFDDTIVKIKPSGPFAGVTTIRVLDEMRPYLIGTGGGELSLISFDGTIVLDEMRPYLIGTGGGELSLISFDGTIVLDEMRPYLIGTGGGELSLISFDGTIVKIKLSGPAAGVTTVRGAVTSRLREMIPSIMGVQLFCPSTPFYAAAPPPSQSQ